MQAGAAARGRIERGVEVDGLVQRTNQENLDDAWFCDERNFCARNVCACTCMQPAHKKFDVNQGFLKPYRFTSRKPAREISSSTHFWGQWVTLNL